MNGRDYTIKLNSFEAGVLMGVIIQLDDRKRQALKAVKGALELNGRDYTIKLNSFEASVLMGVIIQLDDRKRQALKSVYEQLVALKKQVEEEVGVTKEILPGGMLLKIIDRDGNVIIRAPYPWEVEGN